MGYATANGAPDHSKAPEKQSRIEPVAMPTWEPDLLLTTDTAEKNNYPRCSECNTQIATTGCSLCEDCYKQKRPTTDTSELSRFIREASPEEKKRVWLEIAKESSADQRAGMADTSDWLFRFNGKFGNLTVAHMGAYWLREFENIKVFISKELERAREEGKLSTSGRVASFQNGFEAGRGVKENITKMNDAAYQQGVFTERARVREVIEGLFRKGCPAGHESHTHHKPEKYQYNIALQDLLDALKDS
jgi:hypothetical protein